MASLLRAFLAMHESVVAFLELEGDNVDTSAIDVSWDG